MQLRVVLCIAFTLLKSLVLISFKVHLFLVLFFLSILKILFLTMNYYSRDSLEGNLISTKVEGQLSVSKSLKS